MVPRTTSTRRMIWCRPWPSGSADRHVVRDLPDPVGREEARDEHVGVRPVELFGVTRLRIGRDLEPPALLIVEDGREDARGVVARQAQPVYGTVHPHQGRGVQVADDPVVLYGLVAWPGPVLSKSLAASWISISWLPPPGRGLAAFLSPLVIRLPYRPLADTESPTAILSFASWKTEAALR